jgi:hypothetical protein
MPLGQKTRSIVNRPFRILFAPPLTDGGSISVWGIRARRVGTSTRMFGNG